MTTVTAWSKSGLASLLDNCSWAYYLRKVQGQPDPGGPATWLGTGLHAAVEWHQRHRLAAIPTPDLDATVAYAVDAVDLEMAGLEVRVVAEVMARQGVNLNQLHAGVQDAVANWWGAPLKDDGRPLRELVGGWVPIAMEPGFEVPNAVSPRTLRGFIDAIYWDPADRCWVVVDLKTASRFDRWASGEDHWREAAVYIKAAQEAANLPPSGPVRMEWHLSRKERGKTKRFEGARRLAFEPEPHHYRWLEDDIRRADRMLAEGLFAKNPTWNLCSRKWCPHWDGCMVTGELAPGGAGLKAH